MSLESFIGGESGEGMSEGALESLREKMKAAQAQIAAIQKEEKKHKKKDDELVKILLKFVKNSQKKDLVLLISRVIEQNIPANFILAIILLGNEEIQEEIGKFLFLPGAEEGLSNEKALVFFTEEDQSLPLKIKIELDTWIKNLLFQANETPQKLLKTAYKVEFIEEEEEEKEVKTIKKVLIQLITFIIRDYLEQNKVTESFTKLSNFAEFITSGILTKTQENIDNRHFLKSE